jgi:2-amino-4-hydroxy-6-hydroxymethyldihydropteridine diphosphokinase
MAGDLAGGGFDDLAVVALGANLPGADGGPAARLEAALRRFSDHGLPIVKRSRPWRSRAWPDPADPPFINAVALVTPALGPEATLAALHALERAFGRERGRANAPRTLDLDLVAHGRVVRAGPGLVLPHPRAAERRFVMGPLAQIAPGWRHPTLGLRADQLARDAPVGRDAAPSPEGPPDCATRGEPLF